MQRGSHSRLPATATKAATPSLTTTTTTKMTRTKKTTTTMSDSAKKIPIRATIFSAVVWLLNSAFFGSIHLYDGYSYYQRGLAIQMVNTVVAAVRAPLATFITFKFNKKKNISS